ncbi:hypothetical protein [Pseudomonas sp. EMN2]|uniref:hypothetical protein n=1 Tax=Pseudomonas sp. EMN2 TaxID=2615212 RepID=UPI00129BD0A5|nr:hypothetical protein [Pseudomonas sp. EMN2]
MSTRKAIMRIFGILALVVIVITGGFSINPIFTEGLAGVDTASIMLFLMSGIAGAVVLVKLVFAER